MRNEQESRVFVTTPTGNIGKHVASALVERDVPISVLVREGSEKRLDQSVRDRAQVFTGAMSEADTVTQASDGASAMFLALPPDPTTDDLAAQWASFTDAAVAAIKANGITHVVLVSTQGAGPERGSLMGPLFDTERSPRLLSKMSTSRHPAVSALEHWLSLEEHAHTIW